MVIVLRTCASPFYSLARRPPPIYNELYAKSKYLESKIIQKYNELWDRFKKTERALQSLWGMLPTAGEVFFSQNKKRRLGVLLDISFAAVKLPEISPDGKGMDHKTDLHVSF